MEVGTEFREHEWEDAALLRLGLVVAAVHEHVLFSRVAVQVAVQENASLVVQIPYQLLGVVDRRVQVLVWGLPTPVEVTACQRASVIAVYNSIGVEHGYNLEDVLLAQQLGLVALRVCEELEHSSHHP